MKICLSFILILLTATTIGQNRLVGKYFNDSLNENNYIVFNSDSTFKYRLGYELFHDISCGRWRTVKDTVFLTYLSYLRDLTCNNEISPSYPGDTGVVNLRPNKLYFNNGKLYTIEKIEQPKPLTSGTLIWGPPYAWGFRKKYYLFGPSVKKHKDRYYMISEAEVRWKTSR
ncbi:hypothetical protein [Daejeonella sp.]|uniref:hypothetical protein n=1 Tax=Daejeonella sp. TaxID=2805397 RepID=UPI0030BF3529